jgi:hypothetical protein
MYMSSKEFTCDQMYWASVIRAVANGDISINSIDVRAKEQVLEDVENYKVTGEINFD